MEDKAGELLDNFAAILEKRGIRVDQTSEKEKWDRTENSDWIITEAEPLFDAADVARFGKDFFVQKSMVTNDASIEWLRRHYPDHRVHRVTYMEMLPWHIDATLIPLRPGLVLANPERHPLNAAHNR